MFPVDEQIIGSNIRALRNRAGYTVTSLAGKAKMTKSALSKIETGRISAPISTLMRIAEALEVRLAEFFSEPDQNPRYILTRKGKGRIITRDGTCFGYSYEALALGLKGKLAEPFLLTISPGDPVGKFSHGGQEFIYMISGTLEFTIGNDHLMLSQGDSLYFYPTHVHTTRVSGKIPARFLCIFIQDMR